MRTPLLAAALLLAGCVGVTPGPSPAPAADAAPSWALQCDVPLANGWQQACLRQVSSSPRTKAETWAAVNPVDPRNVVLGVKDLDPAKSNACVWVSYYATRDGGASWQDITPAGLYAQRAPPDPAFGWACNTDPMMVFDKDGGLHAVVEFYGAVKSVSALLSAGTRIHVFNSDDGGATWGSNAMLIAGDGLVASPDYPRIAASPTTGTLVASFIDYVAGQRCYLVASRDGGRTAETPILVQVPGSRGCQLLTATSDGAFVTGFLTGDGTPQTMHILASTDDGASWSAPARGFDFTPLPDKFTNTEASPTFGFELVAGRDGRVHAIYADHDAGNADVLTRWSDDRGATWSEPVRVSDDAAGHQQFLPNMALAGDGSLHAFFLDRRYDEADRLNGVTHAWSLDDGATWRNQRVSNVSWDGDLGRHQDGYPWIGDYTGVAAAGDHVWAAFPDTSQGGEPVLVAARVARH